MARIHRITTKRDLHDQENYNSVITHLEPDILECEVKWALGSIHILGISELKWTGMGEFNSDEHYIYCSGKKSLRRNGVAIIVNKRVQNAVNGCNLKNNRMISVHFQGTPFNITVIQVYAPTSNAEEAELNGFMKTYKTF